MTLLHILGPIFVCILVVDRRVSAAPASLATHVPLKHALVQPIINSTRLQGPANDMYIEYHDPGEHIPYEETKKAFADAIAKTLPHLQHHPDVAIPNQFFLHSTMFRPSRDRVTVSVYTVGGVDITWTALAVILLTVKGHMEGSGGSPRQRPYSHELGFRVMDGKEGEEVAVGRVLYVQGFRAATAE